MEVSYVDINECCRCCMNFTDQLDNIFECFYKNFELQEILSVITGLTISVDDGFPQSICDPCKENAMRAFDFRETCIKSEGEIQAIKDNENVSEEEEVTEEVVIEQDNRDLLPCPLCQSLFTSSQELAIHVVNKHQITDEKNETIIKKSSSSGGKKFECKICSKKFESPWKVKRHLLVHKDVVSPLDLPKIPPREFKHQCLECGKRVETPSKLQRHMQVHDKKARLTHGVNQHRPFACNECPHRFWDKVKLEKHKYIHSEEFRACAIEYPEGYMFTCAVCLEQHADYEQSIEHMKSHRDELADKSQIMCRLCNRIYPKLSNVIRHSKLHVENATHQCIHCGRRFGVGDDFIDHMLRHNQFKPHACEFPGCGKSFLKAHKLKIHKATHNQNPLLAYQCDKCDRRFAEIEYLKKHLFRHLGIKSFECTLCPARFAAKNGLESHMTTHTKERKFECGNCGAKFTKSQTLNLHMKIHTKEKNYACIYCDMKFIASGALKRHLRIHTQEKPYKCEYCDKVYAQSNDLIKHLKSHLGPNVYSCSMCSESFAKFNELKDHKMEHYKNNPELIVQSTSTVVLGENYEIESEFI